MRGTVVTDAQQPVTALTTVNSVLASACADLADHLSDVFNTRLVHTRHGRRCAWQHLGLPDDHDEWRLG